MTFNEMYSPEERNLYNPAYIGTILYHAIREYQSHNESGFHCALTYIVAPLALQQRYSSNLPSTITTPIAGWIANNEGELTGFSESVSSYASLVNFAILFLLGHGAIILSDDGKYRISIDHMAKLPVFITQNKAFKRSFQSAGFLGRWFSGASSVESIYAHFGIKP